MSQLEFIALCGRDKSGKTTVSKAAVELFAAQTRERELVHDAVVMTWASCLRDELHTLYGLPRELLTSDTAVKNKVIRMGDYKYNRDVLLLWYRHNYADNIVDFENCEMSTRDLLILHGTYIRRKDDPDYWVKKFDEVVKNLPEGMKYIIIDDTRFPNEFAYLHDKQAHMLLMTNEEVLFAEPPGNDAEKICIDYISAHIEDFTVVQVGIPVNESIDIVWHAIQCELNPWEVAVDVFRKTHDLKHSIPQPTMSPDLFPKLAVENVFKDGIKSDWRERSWQSEDL